METFRVEADTGNDDMLGEVMGYVTKDDFIGMYDNCCENTRCEVRAYHSDDENDYDSLVADSFRSGGYRLFQNTLDNAVCIWLLHDDMDLSEAMPTEMFSLSEYDPFMCLDIDLLETDEDDFVCEGLHYDPQNDFLRISDTVGRDFSDVKVGFSEELGEVVGINIWFMF